MSLYRYHKKTFVIKMLRRNVSHLYLYEGESIEGFMYDRTIYDFCVFRHSTTAVFDVIRFKLLVNFLLYIDKKLCLSRNQVLLS